MKRFSVLSALLVLVLLIGACATPAPAEPAPTAVPTMAPEPTAMPEPEVLDIVDTAAAAGSFNTLLAAADAAGLVDALKGEGPLTVFAPTDDAFAAALDALGLTAEELLADTDTLTSILLYHVVSGKVMSTDLSDGMMVETLNGASATIHLGDGAMIDNANIVTPDIEASNGVIHVIDAVILPPAPEAAAESTPEPTEEAAMMDIVDTAAAAGSFNTLLAAADAAGLVDALKGEGPLTVFAPTDEAFVAALDALGLTAEELLADTDTLTSILLYHVVSGKVMSSDLSDGMMVETLNGASATIHLGDGAMIDNANIVTPDIEASNGVIHVIDAVILPPAPEAAAESTPEPMEEAATMDIVDTAAAAGSFNTLLAAADAAGLVDALKGEGPLTVFAPTDEAFAAALDALGLTAEELLADTDTLTSILLYHVVSGKVMSTDLSDGMMVETLNGASATIHLGDGAMIDNANIVTPDIEASNGVIHVIDAVILPPAN